MTTADGRWTSALVEAITAVDRPGAFCTSGTAPATLPGLDVPGLGPVGLPLSPGQADLLKRQCERAAYGKGEHTVVDTAVRRVWRLPPDRFALANPAWPSVVAGIVAAVQHDLGLERQVLQPHLYDLLLYEPGGFFLPHRDGEKLDRMVATLVVMLPSHYAGGELVVRHEGDERTIDLGGEPSRFQTQYAAFYADCEHEVKPVTAGHRLCLVYNLTLAKAKAAVGAPQRDRHVRQVSGLLGRWPADDDAPAKLAVTLEHQYTKDGLAWDALKGIDRARADVLAAAAAAAGCHAYLALVTLWESGSSGGDGDDDGYSYGRGYHDEEEDDDDDSGDDAGGKYEMDEVMDESLTADGWRSPDGTAVPFGPLPIGEGEVWPAGSLRSTTPEEQFEGYTGNAGMTLDRWYRRAAVVVWPDAHHYDVLCEAGAKQAVPALLQLAEAARQAAGGAAAAVLRDQCRRFATAVLAVWPSSVPQYWHHSVSPSVDPLPALDVIDDVSLVHTYLGDTLQRDTALHPGPGLPDVLSRHGWPTFEDDLVALFQRTAGQSLDRNVGLLELLSGAATRAKGKADRVGLCRRLAGLVVDALVVIDGDPDDRPPGDVAAARLARLVRSLLLVGDDERLSSLVAHVIATPHRYPLQAVQMAAITSVAPRVTGRPGRRSPALDRWTADVRLRLESLTAAAPQPPADQRRDDAVDCKCADCVELNRFLADPVERQHSFKMAQQRRGHVEDQIGRFRCDLDRLTDRRPRPQVLICTKNDATYRRLLGEYHQNLRHLAALNATDAKA